MTANQKRIEQNVLFEIASDLEGTMQLLDLVCECHGVNEGDFTQEDYESLDDLVMCCTQCGWWVETSQMNEYGLICNECEEENKEEEDEE